MEVRFFGVYRISLAQLRQFRPPSRWIFHGSSFFWHVYLQHKSGSSDSLQGEFLIEVFFFFCTEKDLPFIVSNYLFIGGFFAFRFLCVGGCWERTQDCCDFCIGSQTPNHSARSHPLAGSHPLYVDLSFCYASQECLLIGIQSGDNLFPREIRQWWHTYRTYLKTVFAVKKINKRIHFVYL